MGSSTTRGKKTGATTGNTLITRRTTPSDDLTASAAAVALAEPTAHEPAAVESAAAPDPLPLPAKTRKRSTKVAASAAAAEAAPAARKRGRKAAPAEAPAEFLSVEPSSAVPSATAEPAMAEFADPMDLFPQPSAAVTEPAATAPAASATEPELLDALPMWDRVMRAMDAEEAAEAAAEAGVPGATAPVDHDDDLTGDKPVELPFIIDIPREVAPVESEAPAAAGDAWVDQVFEPTPRPAQPADEWVDQVLEPTKPVIPPRPRIRPEAAKPSAAKAAAPKAATPAKAAPPKAASPRSVPARPMGPTATGAKPAAAAGTRWWLLAPLFLAIAALFFANRPARGHAPVPEAVLGTWTTAFWLYEHQTLEIKPDTVVATLDETDEGRYPITKVETADAGRETAVKISYRDAAGDEKVLLFQADKDPTTALRFPSHPGLVWVRADQ